MLLEEALEVKGWGDKVVGRMGIGLGHVRRMRGQSAFLVPGARQPQYLYPLRASRALFRGNWGFEPGRSQFRYFGKNEVAPARTVTTRTGPCHPARLMTFLTARALPGLGGSSPAARGSRTRFYSSIFTRNRSRGGIKSGGGQTEVRKRTTCHARDGCCTCSTRSRPSQHPSVSIFLLLLSIVMRTYLLSSRLVPAEVVTACNVLCLNNINMGYMINITESK